jgi:hypothetical protein
MAAVANGDVRRWLLVLSLIDTGEALVLLPAAASRGPTSDRHTVCRRGSR